MSDFTHQNPEKQNPVAPNGLGSGKIPRSPIHPKPAEDVTIKRLCEADGEALDALFAARATGADRGPTPPGLTERTEKLAALLSLLEHDTVQDPPADLTARTLETIQRQTQQKRFAEQVQMLSEPRRTLGFDWRQLATAAAVFLIGATLLIPVMSRQQADSRRVAGMGNLRKAGEAMSAYAAANLGQMPRGDIRPGTPWFKVGQTPSDNNKYIPSNSAHLYRLVTKGFIDDVNILACPENEHALRHNPGEGYVDWTGPEAVSFSYQNQFTPQLLRLEDNPTMAVLADRNPLFEVHDGQIVFNPDTSFLAPSRAHRGLGQNVLSADGTVRWQTIPTIPGSNGLTSDNFWAASGIDYYTGTETQTDVSDSFLVP